MLTSLKSYTLVEPSKEASESVRLGCLLLLLLTPLVTFRAFFLSSCLFFFFLENASCTPQAHYKRRRVCETCFIADHSGNKPDN